MTIYDERDPTARVFRGEIEVAADPEEVWRTIATGPGITAWFTPSDVEERDGGSVVMQYGPFGSSKGHVTVWDPPHRFGFEEPDWNPEAPDAPPWATEILVEARSGGFCVVRLVSGFFTDGEEWEEHLSGQDEGWTAALANLKVYLVHFAGLEAASMFAVGSAPGEREGVLAGLLRAAGLEDAKIGDQVRLASGTPSTEGVLEERTAQVALLRTSVPGPGTLTLGAFTHDGVTVMARGYWYGPDGEALAAELQPKWVAWLAGHVSGFTERP